MRELVAPAEAVFLDAKVESELAELPEEDALELLESVGQTESGIHALARVGFATLGLQTYLTAGPKESRAWTIPVGATAPKPPGDPHRLPEGLHQGRGRRVRRTDGAGRHDVGQSGRQGAHGGQDYIMADGDVVEFRFNV